jgi:hypothetical protein
MKRPSPPGWGLNARLMTLLCKKITVTRSKEAKAGSSLEESSKEGYGSKNTVLLLMKIMVVVVVMMMI